MDLQVTRKIIDAIHKGKLGRISTKATKVFRLHVPVSCPGVDSKILNPQTDWHDKVGFVLRRIRFLKKFN